MNLDWIKELPSKETPLTKDFFQKLSASILEYAFPIGKTEMFFDNEDHSNYLGFKWERTCIGRVPVGIDSSDTDFNTIGKLGGEKKHTLTVNEIPSHDHEQRLDYGNTVYAQAYNRGEASTGNVVKHSSGTEITYNKPLIYTGNNGGSQPHNNLQPYEVVAFWKRIE